MHSKGHRQRRWIVTKLGVTFHADTTRSRWMTSFILTTEQTKTLQLLYLNGQIWTKKNLILLMSTVTVKMHARCRISLFFSLLHGVHPPSLQNGLPSHLLAVNTQVSRRPHSQSEISSSFLFFFSNVIINGATCKKNFTVAKLPLV